MKTFVAVATYLVCWLILVGIVVSTVPESMENSPALGALLMLIVFIVPGFVASWVSSNYGEAGRRVRQKIDSAIEEHQTKQQIEESKAKYIEAKQRFRYISDQSLLEEYKEMTSREDGMPPEP